MKLGKIYVSSGFLLLTAWLNYADRQGILLPALAACALHELGHLLVIQALGGSVLLFRLTAVGAELRLERPMTYPGELLSALAGPAVNLALAAILCRLPAGAFFAGLNLVLGCFNLLPVGQLDGGRALRCLLAMALGPGAADRAGGFLSAILTRGMLAFGSLLLLWTENFTLLLVAVWLLFQEKEGEKVGNRACQGLWKRVKWFLHSQSKRHMEERHESDAGAHFAQCTKTRPIYRRRI